MIQEQSPLPKGWQEKTLQQVCKKIAGGGTPSRVNPSYFGGKIPWVVIKDIKPIITETSEYLTAEGLKNCSAKMWKEGTVILSTGATIGKIGIAGVVLCTKQGITGFEVKDFLDDKYLFYFLKSRTKELQSKSTGSTIKETYKKDLKKIRILYPDIEIQKKIVKKLDYIFGQLEEKKKMISKLLTTERIQKLILKNSQQLLKSALEGKLTQEWRIANKSKLIPASVLLQKVLDNRRKIWESIQLEEFKVKKKIPKDNKWRQKYKEPLIPESNLPKLPNLWEWVTLNQITWSVRDGPHYSPEYATEGIPFISGGNVRPWGVDFSKAKKITPQLHAELSKRCKPEKNDILYTKGGTTGIACVNTYDNEFNVWVHVAVLKLVNPIEPFYVQHSLNSPFCYSQAQNYTHGVGNKDLGLTRMIRILLPLPPLKEQIEICEVLNKKFSEITSINKKIDEVTTKKETSISYINKISDSVLKEAFSGKLVN